MVKETESGIPLKIKELVETFETHIEAYRSQQYNETQLRREFIDPFFIALGWDVTNSAGYAHAYKDVIHEDAIKIGSATKAPDYCFRIGGVRKFFLEAKKPSINIKDDPHPAYQLRRYAWSAKLPLSILTDFEEFAVYDCQIRPKQQDKSDTARIMYFTYKDYLDKWEKIADIFARESILKGSFDKYAASTKGKRGTTTVDIEFLNEIEKWRDMLAKIIARRNQLSTNEINFCVQRTIDRILFLRMCEDRGIEPYGQLKALSTGERTYKRLCEVFEKADQRYNSGLFHFHDEKERHESPDTLSPNIEIDDKDLKWILYNLYYPQSPYEFSVLPAEILGNVYEQFLGKVIRLTSSHVAKVEDKPEVKKAGGVYYTPSYIVDYIVKNTVGKLIGAPSVCHCEEAEGRRGNPKPLTPKQIEKIKILDPACGSGSFLLGAYTFLLDYHRDWYVANDPKKYTKQLYQGKAGQWFLNIAEKKKILLNNIYGVDIDSQAVEVTKLSLLLKVLEGEDSQTLENQYRLFHERALPNLAENIKCGNSLIGPDFYESLTPSPAEGVTPDKTNPFDWKAEFPQVFSTKNPGFDIIIGNPPYIPIESMTEEEKTYHKDKHSQLERKYDSSVIFIIAMLEKLNSLGWLGFISSITWQTGENFSKLREYLFKEFGILELVNLPFDVFKKAYVDTGIYILCRKPTKNYSVFRFPKKELNPDMNSIRHNVIPLEIIKEPDYKIVFDPNVFQILGRVQNDPKFICLGDITISTQGLSASKYHTEMKPLNNNWFPFLSEGQVYRYQLNIDKLLYADLEKRKTLKQYYETGSKVLIRRVINRKDRIMATYTDKQLVFKKDVNPFVLNNCKENPLYILAIINSSLISYFYINSSSIATKDDFRQTTLAELRKLPIRTIDFNNPNDKSMHDKLVNLVELMLDLHKRLSLSKIPSDKTRIQRQIAATDKQIDTLVYKLYNLTDEEIKIVEGN